MRKDFINSRSKKHEISIQVVNLPVYIITVYKSISKIKLNINLISHFF